MDFDNESGEFGRLHNLFTFHLGIAVTLAWLTSLYACVYAPWVRTIRPLSDPSNAGTVESTWSYLFVFPIVLSVAWLISIFGQNAFRQLRILKNQAWKNLGIDLKVSVAEPGQTIQGLRTGGDLDLAVVFQVGQTGVAWPATINRQWIGDDDFRVVLPAGWGFRPDAKVAADHLSEMPWIMHHPGTSDAMVIERLFAGCNLHPRVVAHSDDFHASLEMAAAGLGAALVPELALRNKPAGVVVLDVPEIRLARNVFALLINDRKTARVQLFVDLLAETLAGMRTSVN